MENVNDKQTTENPLREDFVTGLSLCLKPLCNICTNSIRPSHHGILHKLVLRTVTKGKLWCPVCDTSGIYHGIRMLRPATKIRLSFCKKKKPLCRDFSILYSWAETPGCVSWFSIPNH